MKYKCKQRILAFLLSCAVVSVILPTPAYAYEDAEETAIKTSEELMSDDVESMEGKTVKLTADGIYFAILDVSNPANSIITGRPAYADYMIV